MKAIFEQGEFRNYRKNNLLESTEPISELNHSIFSEQKTTVFISHKHDELDDLKDLIGFIEANYDVKAYIDSKDSSMPKHTSGETATRIKKRIDACDRFIFLATNGAVESKWCNWELGFGDAKKFKNHIALFSMKPKDTSDFYYKGNEYMEIYPYITYFNGTEKYSDTNELIPKGYYVRYKENDTYYIKKLSEWFKRGL